MESRIYRFIESHPDPAARAALKEAFVTLSDFIFQCQSRETVANTVYTVAQAAKRLNTSQRTVHRIITDGKLAGFHIRRSLRIKEEAIRSYENNESRIFQENTGIHKDFE